MPLLNSNVKPGGWVEFQDYDMRNFTQDNSIGEDNKVAELMSLLIEACDKMGRTANPGINLRHWVEEAGFENIKEEVFNIPLGSWPKDKRMVSLRRDHLVGVLLFPRWARGKSVVTDALFIQQKEIGTINMMQFLEGLEGFAMAIFTKILGWTIEEINTLLAGVRKDAMKKDVHMLHKL